MKYPKSTKAAWAQLYLEVGLKAGFVASYGLAFKVVHVNVIEPLPPGAWLIRWVAYTLELLFTWQTLLSVYRLKREDE